MSREVFKTGAQRDSGSDKLRYELISPLALERIARVLTDGAARYGERNWEKGIPVMRCVASALRHLYAYLAHEDDEDHLACLGCNVMFLLHYDTLLRAGRLPRELDDRPDYHAKGGLQ